MSHEKLENYFVQKIIEVSCFLASHNSNTAESLNEVLADAYKHLGENKSQECWDLAYRSVQEVSLEYSEYLDKMIRFGLIQY